jgi:hypothetical protein
MRCPSIVRGTFSKCRGPSLFRCLASHREIFSQASASRTYVVPHNAKDSRIIGHGSLLASPFRLLKPNFPIVKPDYDRLPPLAVRQTIMVAAEENASHIPTSECCMLGGLSSKISHTSGEERLPAVVESLVSAATCRTSVNLTHFDRLSVWRKLK